MLRSDFTSNPAVLGYNQLSVNSRPSCPCPTMGRTLFVKSCGERLLIAFPETFWISSAILLMAYFVRGIAGFGSGLIAIPLLALIHPLSLVVPLVVFFDFIGSASQGVKNRQAIRWDEILPLLPFTVVGCLIALYLFKSIDPTNLKVALGVFILVFAVYQILPLPDLRGSRIFAVPAGLFGGLVGTLFGTGGPFYIIYLSIRGLDKSATRASFATYFFMDGSVRLFGFLAIGLLNGQSFIQMAYWLPAVVVGLLVGGRVHTDIPQSTFKYFISLLLVVSGYRLCT